MCLIKSISFLVPYGCSFFVFPKISHQELVIYNMYEHLDTMYCK